MRSAKYLNAREYAERLYLSDNRDVQDFAREFIEALDFQADDQIQEIRDKLDKVTIHVDTATYVETIDWLIGEAETLGEIEEKIIESCPTYTKAIERGDTVDVIADMLKRLRPVQEYDL